MHSSDCLLTQGFRMNICYLLFGEDFKSVPIKSLWKMFDTYYDKTGSFGTKGKQKSSFKDGRASAQKSNAMKFIFKLCKL